MNQALLNSLTETEQLFVAETTAETLAALDEDAVLELHARARRMRDKYVKNYRRAAGSTVSTVGGRGLSYEKNQRARGKGRDLRDRPGPSEPSPRRPRDPVGRAAQAGTDRGRAIAYRHTCDLDTRRPRRRLRQQRPGSSRHEDERRTQAGRFLTRHGRSPAGEARCTLTCWWLLVSGRRATHALALSAWRRKKGA